MEGDGMGWQPNWFRWLNWALWASALAGLGYLMGLTIWLGAAAVLFPYQLDYGEGVLLHFVREWSLGRPIYKAIEGYPYITSNYAPLPMLLALALTPFLGLTYAAGRLWTLLALATVVTLVIAWIRRDSGSWLPAIVAAMIFGGSPYIYHWAPLFRVDLIGLALTLGGLYAVWRAAPAHGSGEIPSPSSSERPERRRVCVILGLAILLFVAALYAKQSFVFAPLAALAYLFLFVDRWRAVRVAVAVGGLGAGMFLLINALTSGGFWQGLVVSLEPLVSSSFWQPGTLWTSTYWNRRALGAGPHCASG
jgi:hypothetical protein